MATTYTIELTQPTTTALNFIQHVDSFLLDITPASATAFIHSGTIAVGDYVYKADGTACFGKISQNPSGEGHIEDATVRGTAITANIPADTTQVLIAKAAVVEHPVVEFNAVAGTTFTNATDVFNKTVQDPLGAYLCLSAKKRVLHGFLIGKHDDAEKAAHELAEEWASYPSQYTYTKRNGVQVTRGKSVYSNDSAGNAARRSETPEAVVEMMKRIKTQFLNNAKVKQILGT